MSCHLHCWISAKSPEGLYKWLPQPAPRAGLFTLPASLLWMITSPLPSPSLARTITGLLSFFIWTRYFILCSCCSVLGPHSAPHIAVTQIVGTVWDTTLCAEGSDAFVKSITVI